jgi:POT family proton-dependent oligopeptide transporter
MAANTDVKTSLEITKGATALDPIPLETDSAWSRDGNAQLPGPEPTEEEWKTLPRVPGRIPWQAWTVAFVEFAERFSYYGTSAVFVSKLAADQAHYVLHQPQSFY